MKLLSNAMLATAVLCLAACSKGPGDDPEPIADAGSNPAQGSNEGAGANEGTTEDPITGTDNGLAGRIRLPNMENLPTDRELASKENPDKNGGGVIARPPSE